MTPYVRLLNRPVGHTLTQSVIQLHFHDYIGALNPSRSKKIQAEAAVESFKGNLYYRALLNPCCNDYFIVSPTT